MSKLWADRLKVSALLLFAAGCWLLEEYSLALASIGAWLFFLWELRRPEE